MWFFNTIPTKIKEHYTLKTEKLSRQKTDFTTTIELDDPENTVYCVIPFPYTCGHSHGSLQIQKSNYEATILDDYFKLVDYLENVKVSSDEENRRLLMTIRDIMNHYSKDDFGYILFTLKHNEPLHISYTHKIHYSSELIAPISISPIHLTQPSDMTINIEVHNVINHPTFDFMKYYWKDHVLYIEIDQTLFKKNYANDVGFLSYTWESSDDEDENNYTQEDYYNRKEFLKRFGYKE